VFCDRKCAAAARIGALNIAPAQTPAGRTMGAGETISATADARRIADAFARVQIGRTLANNDPGALYAALAQLTAVPTGPATTMLSAPLITLYPAPPYYWGIFAVALLDVGSKADADHAALVILVTQTVLRAISAPDTTATLEDVVFGMLSTEIAREYHDIVLRTLDNLVAEAKNAGLMTPGITRYIIKLSARGVSGTSSLTIGALLSDDITISKLALIRVADPFGATDANVRFLRETLVEMASTAAMHMRNAGDHVTVRRIIGRVSTVLGYANGWTRHHHVAPPVDAVGGVNILRHIAMAFVDPRSRIDVNIAAPGSQVNIALGAMFSMLVAALDGPLAPYVATQIQMVGESDFDDLVEVYALVAALVDARFIEHYSKRFKYSDLALAVAGLCRNACPQLLGMFVPRIEPQSLKRMLEMETGADPAGANLTPLLEHLIGHTHESAHGQYVDGPHASVLRAPMPAAGHVEYGEYVRPGVARPERGAMEADQPEAEQEEEEPEPGTPAAAAIVSSAPAPRPEAEVRRARHESSGEPSGEKGRKVPAPDTPLFSALQQRAATSSTSGRRVLTARRTPLGPPPPLEDTGLRITPDELSDVTREKVEVVIVWRGMRYVRALAKFASPRLRLNQRTVLDVVRAMCSDVVARGNLYVFMRLVMAAYDTAPLAIDVDLKRFVTVLRSIQAELRYQVFETLYSYYGYGLPDSQTFQDVNVISATYWSEFAQATGPATRLALVTSQYKDMTLAVPFFAGLSYPSPGLTRAQYEHALQYNACQFLAHSHAINVFPQPDVYPRLDAIMRGVSANVVDQVMLARSASESISTGAVKTLADHKNTYTFAANTIILLLKKLGDTAPGAADSMRAIESRFTALVSALLSGTHTDKQIIAMRSALLAQSGPGL